MRKEIQIIKGRVVEVEFHTHRFGCRMVERIMSASPEVPKKPFRGKNFYSKRSQAKYERDRKRMSDEHLEELRLLALETNKTIYEHLFGSSVIAIRSEIV